MPRGVYARPERKTVKVGDVFTRWTVVEPAVRHRYFKCLCICGNSKEIRDDSLMNGDSGSCGCLAAEQAGIRAVEIFTTHGLSGSKVWSAYKDMVSRCTNKEQPNFRTYGAIGIEVCERWSSSRGFLCFVEDMGIPEKGDTLERISVLGNYEPTNCKWEPSLSVQGYNKRLRPCNSSGKTGVRQNYGAWQAFIQKEGVFYNLGRFLDFEDAVVARRAGEMEYYGFYQEDAPFNNQQM